jgi:hypothetical protein
VLLVLLLFTVVLWCTFCALHTDQWRSKIEDGGEGDQGTPLYGGVHHKVVILLCTSLSTGPSPRRDGALPKSRITVLEGGNIFTRRYRKRVDSRRSYERRYDGDGSHRKAIDGEHTEYNRSRGVGARVVEHGGPTTGRHPATVGRRNPGRSVETCTEAGETPERQRETERTECQHTHLCVPGSGATSEQPPTTDEERDQERVCHARHGIDGRTGR